jgi:hypothetical protein
LPLHFPPPHTHTRCPAGYGPAEASPVLRDFAGRWKASIEAMHREVAAQVPEPGCSRELLQVRSAVKQHVTA